MRSSNRRAFTLVELLVVISIIGMLAALLLPAINAAREAGRKSVCISNQRQVGLAIVQHEINKGRFPGYVVPQAELPDPADRSKKIATRPISWVFAILPWLERRDLMENFGVAAGTAALPDSGPYAIPNLRLNLLVCPSDARAGYPDPEGLAENASLSYIVNCGVKDERTDVAEIELKESPSAPPTMGPPTSQYSRDWASNGIFQHHFPFEGPNSSGHYVACRDRVTHVTSASIRDGAATTLLLSENVDSGNWTNVLEQYVGFYWQAAYDPSDPNQRAIPTCCVEECIPCPGCGLWEFLSTGVLEINDNPGGIDSAGVAHGACHHQGKWPFARPSSYHLNGVVATYADGHAAFLNDDVEYLVFCLLMTPYGRYSRPAGSKSVDASGEQIFYLHMEKGRAQYARTTLNEDDF